MKGEDARSFSFFFIGGIMLERDFQKEVIAEIKELFPDCYVLKCDGSNTPQGFPDILVLYKDKWVTLEFKRSHNASHQIHQDYYVDRLNEMSYSRFIYPENKEEVLNELRETFGA